MWVWDIKDDHAALPCSLSATLTPPLCVQVDRLRRGQADPQWADRGIQGSSETREAQPDETFPHLPGAPASGNSASPFTADPVLIQLQALLRNMKVSLSKWKQWCQLIQRSS